MLDDDRKMLSLCNPEVTLQSGLSDDANHHYYVAARCVENGWLVHVRDEQEVIPGPPPSLKIERSIYRITPAGAAALSS